MSSKPITAELREFADEIYERAGYGAPYEPSSENEELYAIADRIDAEHERLRDFAMCAVTMIMQYGPELVWREFFDRAQELGIEVEE